MKKFFVACWLCSQSLFGLAYHAPWLTNFLEVRSDFSVEQLSLSNAHHQKLMPSHLYRHRTQGIFSLSASPYPDWEYDLALLSASPDTGKISLRAERQVLSDLQGDLCAFSLVGKGEVMHQKRARQPLFTETAGAGGEIGFGIGRHLWIAPWGYTQLFSYVKAGIGDYSSRWVAAEVGVQQGFLSRHFVRCHISYIKGLGTRNDDFRGIGSLHAALLSFQGAYVYRWNGGIETSIAYLVGCLQGKVGMRTQRFLLSLSIPLSL